MNPRDFILLLWIMFALLGATLAVWLFQTARIIDQGGLGR